MKTRLLNSCGWHLFGLLLLICSSGCSAGSGTIEGTVTAGGKPVQGVEVIFRFPELSAEGSGISNAQGKYRVFHGRGDRNLPTGEYQLTLGIMLPEDESGMRSKLHKHVKQFNEASSPKVIVAGKNIIDIEIDSDSME